MPDIFQNCLYRYLDRAVNIEQKFLTQNYLNSYVMVENMALTNKLLNVFKCFYNKQIISTND